MVARGVFPGSFDPLTVGHLHVADCAVSTLGLVALDFAISQVALAKEHRRAAPIEERLAAIRRHAAGRPWLGAVATEAQLLADVAEGYDVLVIGADKWHQLFDRRFYADDEDRDAALRRLPHLAVAPRAGSVVGPPPVTVPGLRLTVLDPEPAIAEVSSSAVRAGRQEWRAEPPP